MNKLKIFGNGKKKTKKQNEQEGLGNSAEVDETVGTSGLAVASTWRAMALSLDTLGREGCAVFFCDLLSRSGYTTERTSRTAKKLQKKMNKPKSKQMDQNEKKKSCPFTFKILPTSSNAQINMLDRKVQQH